MARRIGQALAVAGWILGAVLLWAAISMGLATSAPTWFLIAIAAFPVLVGHVCQYILSG
jgi:hypothetical protein